MDLQTLASNKKFTADEKKFLKAEAVRVGITFHERKNCQNCFQDLAVQIFAKQNPKPKTDDPAADYILKSGVDVRFADSGIRVNAATFTQEIGAMLVRKGLTKYLAKYPSV